MATPVQAMQEGSEAQMNKKKPTKEEIEQKRERRYKRITAKNRELKKDNEFIKKEYRKLRHENTNLEYEKKKLEKDLADIQKIYNEMETIRYRVINERNVLEADKEILEGRIETGQAQHQKDLDICNEAVDKYKANERVLTTVIAAMAEKIWRLENDN